MKLILDYNTWRCGGDSTITKYDDSSNSSFTTIYNTNKLGEGNTALLNDQGYMCCLGQFSPQLNSNVKMEYMEGLGEPHDLQLEIPLLTELFHYDEMSDTKLSTDAININDDYITTPEEKIVLLKELFAKVDCEIEVINLP